MSEITSRLEPRSEAPRGSEMPTSVIGPTVVVRGEISAEEDLLVMGRVEGTIDHNQRLTIHSEGVVNASIKAQEITVEGTVLGNIYGTKRVRICATARVQGNVYAPSVGLVEGSMFKGTVDMEFDSKAVEHHFYELTGKNPTPAVREVNDSRDARKEKVSKRAASGEPRPKAARPDAARGESSDNPDSTTGRQEAI